MEMDAKTLAIIEKVRKLLAMANGNANENEAAVAASKAQELLEAYNLDMLTVNRRANTHTARTRENKAGGLYKWQRDLWNAVSRLNFCMYWYRRGLTAGSQYEHEVVGSPANVISTEVMARYLEQAIERLARTWVAKDHPGRSIFIKPAIAYREGAAQRIVEKLWQLRWEHEREQEKARKEERARNAAMGINTENALVLQDVANTEEDLNNDFINGWEPGTSARNRVAAEARRAAAMRAAEELMAKQAEWDAANPEAAAARKAKEARERAERYANWEREQANERKRKPTAEELRRNSPEFLRGYEAGNSVSLNRQVDKTNAKMIG